MSEKDREHLKNLKRDLASMQKHNKKNPKMWQKRIAH